MLQLSRGSPRSPASPLMPTLPLTAGETQRPCALVATAAGVLWREVSEAHSSHLCSLLWPWKPEAQGPIGSWGPRPQLSWPTDHQQPSVIAVPLPDTRFPFRQLPSVLPAGDVNGTGKVPQCSSSGGKGSQPSHTGDSLP